MKHKFSRILGVGLSLMLLMSLLAFAAPVSAGTLKWGTETIPSTTGKVLAAGTDILDFAVGGDEETIYAAGGTEPLVSSGDGSAEWSDTYAKSGSYSLKLQAPTGGDYGKIIFPSEMAFEDLTDFSCYVNAASAQDLPLLEIELKEITEDVDVGSKTIPYATVGRINIASQPEDAGPLQTDANAAAWELYGTDSGTPDIDVSGAAWRVFWDADGDGTFDTNSGSLLNWAAIHTAFDAKATVQDVRVEMVWPPSAATVYVDDITINTVTYDLEPGIPGPGVVYKSTNAGATWSSISVPSNVGLVAVAPDDEDIVAIVAGDQSVYVTTDGGTTWGDLKFTGISDGVINDIAISTESAGTHYVALAAEDAGVAEVWRYNIGAAAPSWKEISGTAYEGFEAADTAAAVAYSPNFPSDQVLAVVTFAEDLSSGTIDYVKLQLWSENQDMWNTTAGFDSYPAPIVSEDLISGLASASISLDPEYLGSDDAMRISFVGLSVEGNLAATELSGIHRMDDTTHKALKEGTTVDVHSIAYDGSTVVAGRHGTNTAVWYCLDPLATSPSVKGASSLKRPGGTNSVVVAWVGTDVVAGTSGDESAFAVSVNDGKAFNDISLIDTTLTNMRDVAVSPDGSVVYMATDDGADLSLWRNAASWQRVLSVQGKDNFIVRLAPDDPAVVYVADKGTTSIYYSNTGGTERWQGRSSRYDVQDLAVETDGDVAYVLIAADGKVSKSSNSGFTWGSAKSSKLTGGNMIVSLGEDALLAASDDGYVSYSTDGADSFTKIGKKVGDTSADVVAIASGVADGDYVYAGLKYANMDIYRWQLGTSTSWSSIYEGVGSGANVTGMVLFDKVLYAMTARLTTAPDVGSLVLRSLDPTDAVSVSWSSVNKTDVRFDTEPQGLRVTGGSAKMWAVDTINDALYGYTDTLAILGPELVGPAPGFEVGINPVSGYTMDVTFSWLKPSARVTEYELRLAFDSGFDEVAKKLYPESTSSTVGYVVGHSATGVFDLMPGDTYYWKVRVSKPLLSPWSVYRFVTVTEAVPPVTTVTVTPAPAPEITVEAPPPPQVTVTVPPAPTPVTAPPAIPAYLLWTIICIGAVLIIALIVLIVRTRRVV